MKIEIDTTVHAVYIELKPGKVAKTREFAPELFLDFDSKGTLMGIEMLNPGKISLKQVAEKYRVPELRKVHPKNLEKVYAY